MIALLLDILGAYYLNRKVVGIFALILAAVLMGLASTIVAVIIAFLAMPNSSDGDTPLIFLVAIGHLKLFWIHPIACAVFALRFRRKGMARRKVS
jgi:hypothetical protein